MVDLKHFFEVIVPQNTKKMMLFLFSNKDQDYLEVESSFLEGFESIKLYKNISNNFPYQKLFYLSLPVIAIYNGRGKLDIKYQKDPKLIKKFLERLKREKQKSSDLSSTPNSGGNQDPNQLGTLNPPSQDPNNFSSITFQRGISFQSGEESKQHISVFSGGQESREVENFSNQVREDLYTMMKEAKLNDTSYLKLVFLVNNLFSTDKFNPGDTKVKEFLDRLRIYSQDQNQISKILAANPSNFEYIELCLSMAKIGTFTEDESLELRCLLTKPGPDQKVISIINNFLTDVIHITAMMSQLRKEIRNQANDEEDQDRDGAVGEAQPQNGPLNLKVPIPSPEKNGIVSEISSFISSNMSNVFNSEEIILLTSLARERDDILISSYEILVDDADEEDFIDTLKRLVFNHQKESKKSVKLKFDTSVQPHRKATPPSAGDLSEGRNGSRTNRGEEDGSLDYVIETDDDEESYASRPDRLQPSIKNRSNSASKRTSNSNLNSMLNMKNEGGDLPKVQKVSNSKGQDLSKSEKNIQHPNSAFMNSQTSNLLYLPVSARQNQTLKTPIFGKKKRDIKNLGDFNNDRNFSREFMLEQGSCSTNGDNNSTPRVTRSAKKQPFNMLLSPKEEEAPKKVSNFNKKLVEFVLHQKGIPKYIAETCSLFTSAETSLELFNFNLKDNCKMMLTQLFKSKIKYTEMETILTSSHLFLDIFNIQNDESAASRFDIIDQAATKARRLLDNLSKEISEAARNSPVQNNSPTLDNRTNNFNDCQSVHSLSANSVGKHQNAMKYKKGGNYSYLKLELNTLQKTTKKSKKKPKNLIKVKQMKEDSEDDDAKSENNSIQKSQVSYVSHIQNKEDSKKTELLTMLYKFNMDFKPKLLGPRRQMIKDFRLLNIRGEENLKEMLQINHQPFITLIFEYKLSGMDFSVVKDRLIEMSKTSLDQATVVTQMETYTRKQQYVLCSSLIKAIFNLKLINKNHANFLEDCIMIENIDMIGMIECYQFSEDLDEFIDNLTVLQMVEDNTSNVEKIKNKEEKMSDSNNQLKLLFTYKKQIQKKCYDKLLELIDCGDVVTKELYKEYVQDPKANGQPGNSKEFINKLNQYALKKYNGKFQILFYAPCLLHQTAKCSRIDCSTK